MELRAPITIKSNGGGQHIATMILSDGKTFTWTFPVHLFSAESDLTKFANQAMSDVLLYLNPMMTSQPIKTGL